MSIIFFSKRILYGIHSDLLSFHPDYCHSFRIIVIPSEFLPFQIFVILNSSCTLPYPKGEKIGQQSRPYLRVCNSLLDFMLVSILFTERHRQKSRLSRQWRRGAERRSFLQRHRLERGLPTKVSAAFDSSARGSQCGRRL